MNVLVEPSGWAAAMSLIFVFGLLVGSFLNVVIWRLPRGENLSRPRSKCPGCDTLIRWFDNIPVVSWLLLRGRCRKCRMRISWRYPAVEILTAVLFAAVAWGVDNTTPSPDAGKAPPASGKIHGIDVSHYNGDIDWQKVKDSGIAFTFVKATDGLDYLDPTFVDRVV